MNMELLESFGQNYPEELDGALDCCVGAICCKFNRWGSLLAVGCTDGRAMLVDFITRQQCRMLNAHVLPVASLSWSRNGSRLLTGSADCTAALWNVADGECVSRFRFPSNVLKVQMHPRDWSLFLVCILKHPCVLVNVQTATHTVVPMEEESGAGASAAECNVTACFDRRGRHILAGNGRGRVTVYTTERLEPVAGFRLQSNHAIRSLEFARRGDTFVTNSADRVIRVYDLREVLVRGVVTSGAAEPVQKLTDMVNKTLWRACCLSGNGEYVCAGSQKGHALYIWEKNSATLVKILHGAKGEQLADVQWHPARPVICSVANGTVGVWTQSHVENWSAFAPDFRELDENVEYEERESEFDIEDEDRSVELNTEKADEDETVDVTTSKAPAAFCSSDEEDAQYGATGASGEKPLWFLSIAPEMEPAAGASDAPVSVDGGGGTQTPSAAVPPSAPAVGGSESASAAAIVVKKEESSPWPGAGPVHDIDVKPLVQGDSSAGPFAAPNATAAAYAPPPPPASRKRSAAATASSGSSMVSSRTAAKQRRITAHRDSYR